MFQGRAGCQSRLGRENGGCAHSRTALLENPQALSCLDAESPVGTAAWTRYENWLCACKWETVFHFQELFKVVGRTLDWIA